MQAEPTTNNIVFLSALRVQGFRSLGDVRIEFEPGVNALVGRNAAGKSNIVDALRFMDNALYDGVDRPVKYRGSRTLLHRHAGTTARYIRIGLEFESETLHADYEVTIRIDRAGEASIESERIRGSVLEPVRRNLNISLRRGRFVSPRLPGSESQSTLDSLSSTPYSLMISVMGDSSVMAQIISHNLYDQPTDRLAATQVVSAISNFVGDMRFYNLFPNIMGSPKPPTGEDTLEEDGGNLPGVVKRIVRDRSTPYDQLVAALNHLVPDVMDIRVSEAGGYNFVQLLHRSFGGYRHRRGWLDLSEESDGTIRVLGLLVALYQEPAPSLIVIEEPELTVHVGALGVLVDAINEVSRRSQILITTHSSDLLDYLPTKGIRVVTNTEGQTKIGAPRATQLDALRNSLLTAGEIHRIEGLSIE